MPRAHGRSKLEPDQQYYSEDNQQSDTKVQHLPMRSIWSPRHRQSQKSEASLLRHRPSSLCEFSDDEEDDDQQEFL